MHGNGPFFNRMGFNPFCPFFCPFFINTILTVEAKNGPLNGETLNGLKDVKCEQTFSALCRHLCKFFVNINECHTSIHCVNVDVITDQCYTLSVF